MKQNCTKNVKRIYFQEDMNNLLKFFFMVFAGVVIASCGGRKAAVPSNQEELDRELEYLYRDSTIYGICGEESSANTLHLITDNGENLMLNTLAATENHNVFGHFDDGDRMAVIANESRTEAEIIINLSMLMGDWVMPNPLDGTSYMGFSIKDGGIAESLNQSSIIYKTWQLQNGRLQIVSVREGGGDFEEEEVFQFLKLTGDSLILQGNDEIYEYSRPGMAEDYDEIEFDDEEDDFEDLVI